MRVYTSLYVFTHTQTNGNADGGNPFTDLNLCSSVSVNTCSSSSSIRTTLYPPDSPHDPSPLAVRLCVFISQVYYIYCTLLLRQRHSPPLSLGLVLYHSALLSTDYNGTAIMYMQRGTRHIIMIYYHPDRYRTPKDPSRCW